MKLKKLKHITFERTEDISDADWILGTWFGSRGLHRKGSVSSCSHQAPSLASLYGVCRGSSATCWWALTNHSRHVDVKLLWDGLDVGLDGGNSTWTKKRKLILLEKCILISSDIYLVFRFILYAVLFKIWSGVWVEEEYVMYILRARYWGWSCQDEVEEVKEESSGVTEEDAENRVGWRSSLDIYSESRS